MKLTALLQRIPMALVVLRFGLGPLLLAGVWLGMPGIWVAIGFVIGFLSDVFDGVIARRLKVVTAGLRQADSWADITFYLCLGLGFGLRYADGLYEVRVGLLAFVVVWLLWALVNLVKYQRLASYHTYLAKACGIAVCVAVLAMFIVGSVGWTTWLAIGLGVAYNLEEIAMTLVLPVWTHDVPTVFHALKIREQLLNEKPN